MAHAHFMMDSEDYKHTLRICNNYCFSNAAIVVWTLLGVTSYVSCLSCYLITARTERLYLQKLSVNFRLFHAVFSTWTEPFPGWIDNFNGPVGLMVATGKGVLRTILADPNTTTDYIPVDICIQFMLLAAWCKAVGR
jgi:hypothetical protein